MYYLPGLIISPGLVLIRSCRPSRWVKGNWKPQSASVKLSVCSTKRSSDFLLNLGCSRSSKIKTMSPVMVSGCNLHKWEKHLDFDFVYLNKGSWTWILRRIISVLAACPIGHMTILLGQASTSYRVQPGAISTIKRLFTRLTNKQSLK